MLNASLHLLFVSLAKGIGDELLDIGLLFLLELSEQFLLEVCLDYGEHGLYAIELRAVRYVEDRHNAQSLHGFGTVL